MYLSTAGGHITAFQRGFRHATVNHFKEFVNAETGTHTNTIESVWRWLKVDLPETGSRRKYMPGHILEHLWRKKYGMFTIDASDSIVDHIRVSTCIAR